ncbi:metallopeptidase TldD-related protein [Catenuloplanes atrovinosus]|uniref:Zn-dependent protease n=1 Tax=Catenuloplanes atrovinosus TaxID=137266 RepID=A0AAE4C9U4_9ACTN|nr:metallopeptidase TldD-related protein [Catenuloplanes atrovinosus]MDR7276192.1 putative Zn-dependent protease [Catenuloplanes atrovinosus]
MTAADAVAARVAEALPGAEAEVFVQHVARGLTRFANSAIHQNITTETTEVRLRVHRDGRTVALSGPDPEALIARAGAALAAAPADRTWPGLTPPAAARERGNLDEETAAATPADRAARVRDFVRAADGLEAAGYVSTTTHRAAFANTLGHVAEGHTTEAALDGIARTETSDGVSRLASVRLADLDGAVLGARAAAKARASDRPEALLPGRYEVVLEPTAVADVLNCLAIFGFNGRTFAEGMSFARLGADQLDPAITLLDDPVAPGGTGLPFDGEGTIRGTVPLVEKGVIRTILHDRQTAALTGGLSTGHHSDSGFGVLASCLHLLPSGAGPADEVDGPEADSHVAALVRDVERGLLVTDNWYTRVLDPKTLVMTGLTRNGLWLIEDGRVVRPVQNLRFTQSYPLALAPGAVLGVGASAVGQPANRLDTGFRAPALRLASWNYTGNAAG